MVLDYRKICQNQFNSISQVLHQMILKNDISVIRIKKVYISPLR